MGETRVFPRRMGTYRIRRLYLRRRLNALLLDLDVRSRGGTAFDKQDLLELADSYVLALQNLADGSGRAEASLLIKDIAQASTDFHQPGNQARSSFQTASSEVNEIGKYVRYCCRLTYRAVDYVRWHSQMTFSAEGDSVANALTAVLEGLSALQSTLDSLDGKRLDLSAGQFERLREQWRQLEDSRTVVEGILAREISSAAEKYADDPDYRLRAERLLATPLLSSQQRETVLVAIENAAISGPDRIADQPLTLAGWPLPSAKLSQADLSRLVQQLELQQKLFQLVDRDLGDELSSMVRKLDSTARSGTDNETWELLRSAGARLGKAYAELPARIEQSAMQGSSRAERMLRLVDARDAQQLGHQQWGFPTLRILPPPTARILHVTQQDPTGDVRLALKTWRPLTLRVEQTDKGISTVDVNIDYPPDAIEIRRQGSENVVATGVLTADVPLQPDRTLVYEVRALQTRKGQSADQQVTFTVQAGERNTPLKVRLLLPKPNSIDLLAQRVAPVESTRRVTADGLRLRPFPNRSTQYQFSLTNLSDEQKDVNVAFFAVDRPSGAAFAQGKLLGPRR